MKNLAAIDLNLLVAFDALLAERNVTRAGRRIGLSQSAMSHALKRLRSLLDDPILVKSTGGMRPTTFAESMAPRIRRLLDEIRDTLGDGQSFDPAKDARRYTIATNDHAALVLIPPLMERVRAAAPRVELRVRALGRDLPAQALADGDLDLAIGTFLGSTDGVHHRELFREQFLCLLRRDHPSIGKRLTLERYAKADHVLIASPGEGPGVVDFALEKLGLSRRVAVSIPFFMIAPAIVARTDCIVTIAERIARYWERTHGLRAMKPPVELQSFPVTMTWHERSERDPARAWLRSLVVEAAG